MDTTAPELAHQLGMSLPAVHRALDGLGVVRAGRGHTRRVPDDALDRLTAARGVTPRHETPASELKVLAALSRAPLGLPSARQVAAYAGLSPTTASDKLHSLRDRRLVARVATQSARGRARSELRWTAQVSAWPDSLRSAVRQTTLPQPSVSVAATDALPRSLEHLFWNADPAQLSPEVDGSYMAGRLLESPDIRAWRWALAHLSTADIEKAMTRRGVDPRTRALAENSIRHG